MNILFWNDTLEVGGGETWALRTAVHLRKRGHSVGFACPGGSWIEAQALRNGFPHFDYFFDPAFSGHFLWQAEAFMRQHATDAILCTVMGNRTEAALLSGLVRKLDRGSILLRVGSAPWPGLSTAHLGYGMEDVVRGVLVNSAFLKRQVLARFPEIAPDRLELLHNGVDTTALNSPDRRVSRANLRRELRVPEGAPLMAAVGRLTEVKNYPLLLRVAAKVFRAFPGAVLAIVGEGDELERLKGHCERLGIAGCVRFTGFRKDIPEILHASDLFVHPSLMEGSPNAVLEAMASGRPVVATDAGGIPEIVQHEETGFLTPSGDEEAMTRAVLRMLEDPEARARMGEAGRVRAQRLFDREAQVAKLERYLDQTVGWRTEFHLPGFPPPAGTGLPPQPPEMFFPSRCHGRYRRSIPSQQRLAR